MLSQHMKHFHSVFYRLPFPPEPLSLSSVLKTESISVIWTDDFKKLMWFVRHFLSPPIIPEAGKCLDIETLLLYSCLPMMCCPALQSPLAILCADRLEERTHGSVCTREVIEGCCLLSATKPAHLLPKEAESPREGRGFLLKHGKWEVLCVSGKYKCLPLLCPEAWQSSGRDTSMADSDGQYFFFLHTAPSVCSGNQSTSYSKHLKSSTLRCSGFEVDILV